MRSFDAGVGPLRRFSALATIACAFHLGTGCQNASVSETIVPDSFRKLSRAELNARATRAGLPFFWVDDVNRNGALEARELAVLWGTGADASEWLTDGKLTARFAEAYTALAKPAPQAKDPRMNAVQEELAQAVPTLVYTDFASASPEDQAFVQKAAEVAARVERVYMRQLGSLSYLPKLKDLDGPSRTLFFRNQSPWCLAPSMRGNPACNALPDKPPQVSELYPAAMQGSKDFCDTLSARDDAEQLLARFVAVREKDGQLRSVPYAEVFKPEMEAVADSLTELAALLSQDVDAALKKYILAAADAFRTNDWMKADRAWIDSFDSSTRWYLRIAPDVTFFSPCGRKSMFGMTLGRFDRRSRAWKRKLALIESKMEQSLAALAGPPYKARDVDFSVPDFVTVLLNAGDSRRPIGAYIGQSVPLRGPLVEAGLQRTLAFSNLYADPDSRAHLDATMRAHLCTDSIGRFSSTAKPRVIISAMHGATRGLGPTRSYMLNGRSPEAIFGGLNAAILEELKAISASMYFVQWLREKELIEPEVANEVFAFGLLWDMSHISRGVFQPDGRPIMHGHVTAAHVASWLESGALVWREDEMAANGQDKGCLSFVEDRMAAWVKSFVADVLRIKATGDVDGARALLKRYVEDGPQDLFKEIQKRTRRQPRASFVYAFRTGEQK